MSDIGGTVIELGIGVGLLVAIGMAVKKLGVTNPFSGVSLPFTGSNNGQYGATFGVQPVTTSAPTGKPLGTCSGANVPSPGSRVGNQVFLGPNSTPNCGSLTYVNTGSAADLNNESYQQAGYIDPNSGQAVGTDQMYIVYRCINWLTGADDGYYYLSPIC